MSDELLAQAQPEWYLKATKRQSLSARKAAEPTRAGELGYDLGCVDEDGPRGRRVKTSEESKQ